MDDITRLERIDALADRWLKRADELRPATEVWDAAAVVVDALYARELALRLDKLVG